MPDPASIPAGGDVPEPRPGGTRRRLFVAATLLLLAWTAFAAALEVYRCGWIHFADPWPAIEPARWRVTSRHVAALRDFAERIAPEMPAGASVAVTTEPGPEGQRFFRYLWLSYLLPGQELRMAATPADGFGADYRLAWGTRLDHPRLEAVAAAGEGVLYRVLPPGAGR